MFKAYKEELGAMAKVHVPTVDTAEPKVPAIVTTGWLQDHLHSPNVKLVDGTYHLESMKRDAKAEYDIQHIPGAVYFDIDECADTSSELNLPHILPTPEQFERYVGSRGIGNENHVVVYDNNPQFPIFSSQRVWWTFRVFGHDRVSVLEGGLSKWMARGGTVTSDTTEIKPVTFNACFRPELVKTYDDVEKNIKSGNFSLVDARPPGRYHGTASEPIPGVKPGHIPGSSNVPFMKIMDLESKSYRSPEELKKYFDECNVDLTKPVTFTCGSGLQASNLVLASFLCGKEDAALYDGSWVEWFRRAPADLMEEVPSD